MVEPNEELNLPVFSEAPPNHKYLSMDDYDQFVMEDLEHAFDRESYEKEKKLRRVTIPFSIDA